MNTENTEPLDLDTLGFGESIQCIMHERSWEEQEKLDKHLAAPKDEPYFLEVGDNGCEKCGFDKTWDIIQPNGVAAGTSYGDLEEAEEICDMLNIAYALGRASNARV